MPKNAKVFTVDVASTTCAVVFTDFVSTMNVKNLDSNNTVWLNTSSSDAAVAEADDTIPVLAGESIQIPYTLSFTAIAETASVKIHVWGFS